MAHSLMERTRVFNNKVFGTVRTMLINGEPYFVGKDVAVALGYSNPQKALRDHIDDEDKTLNKSFTVNGTMIILINESGLYSLILSSKLPNAKAFKRWVTSEVLPSIRKTGRYDVSKEMESQELMAKALMVAQSIITELRPKAEYAELMLQNRMLIGDFGELLKQSGINTGSRKLQKWLRDNGYLINAGKQYNTPTQWAMDMELFETEDMLISIGGITSKTKRVYITGKGQQFILEILKPYAAQGRQTKC